jgi:hypothetical protein
VRVRAERILSGNKLTARVQYEIVFCYGLDGNYNIKASAKQRKIKGHASESLPHSGERGVVYKRKCESVFWARRAALSHIFGAQKSCLRTRSFSYSPLIFFTGETCISLTNK